MLSVFECCDEIKAGIEEYLAADPDAESFVKEFCRRDFVCTGNNILDSKIYDYLYNIAQSDKLTFDQIRSLHKLIIPNDEEAGTIRNKRIPLSSSRIPVPSNEMISPLLASLFHWINEKIKDKHPIKEAAMVQAKFAYIYPFSKGTLELAMQMTNILLIKSGYPPISVTGEQRLRYQNHLEKARTHPQEFEEFIAERVLESQTVLLQKLKEKKMADEKSEPKKNTSAATEIKGVPHICSTDTSSEITNPIYNLIKSTPGIRKEEIAQKLEFPIFRVDEDITSLMISGRIEYRGDNTSGGYFIAPSE